VLDAFAVLDIIPMVSALLSYGIAVLFGLILAGCGIYWRRFTATVAAIVLIGAPPAMLAIALWGIRNWGQKFGADWSILGSVFNELLTGFTCVSLANILAFALLVSAIRPRTSQPS